MACLASLKGGSSRAPAPSPRCGAQRSPRSHRHPVTSCVWSLDVEAAPQATQLAVPGRAAPGSNPGQHFLPLHGHDRRTTFPLLGAHGLLRGPQALSVWGEEPLWLDPCFSAPHWGAQPWVPGGLGAGAVHFMESTSWSSREARDGPSVSKSLLCPRNQAPSERRASRARQVHPSPRGSHAALAPPQNFQGPQGPRELQVTVSMDLRCPTKARG